MLVHTKSFRWALVLLIVLRAIVASATPPPGEWRPGFGLPGGTDGEVTTVLRVGTDLYVGGSFCTAGSVVASGIARWDGTAWHSLGTGPANGISQQEDRYRVTTLAAAANGDLYVGGDFDRIGGIESHNLARWDGQRWHAMKGVRGPVQALAIAPNGDVYVAGQYHKAAYRLATYLARWNGRKWQQLRADLAEATPGEWLVSSLAAAPEGGVYVGGAFHQVGGRATSAVARFDGQAWHTFQPTNPTADHRSRVHRLLVASDGRLYAGGQFVQPNDSLAAGVARWTDGSWRLLGPADGPGSINGFIDALASTERGELYAGGYFFQQRQMPVHGVLRWDGYVWKPLSTDTTTRLPGDVTSLALGANGDVYAGGSFKQAGAALLNHVARWDGTRWQPLNNSPAIPTTGAYAEVSTLTWAPDGTLYGSGRFYPAAGGPEKKVARWDGHHWQPLNSGPAPDPQGRVDALAVAPSGDVYAGGTFTYAGGRLANGIARWDGRAWHPLGTGLANENYGGAVFALAIAPTGDVYVGGVFVRAGEVPAHHVARWDGHTWHALGTGPANGVDAGRITALLLAPSGDLYVSGFFKHAGDVEASCIARWDGTRWHPLGAGAEIGVSTLAWGPAGELYAGGLFHQAGGVPASGVARWDGTRWLPLGAGVGPDGDTMGTVEALAVAPAGEVYVSGRFQQVGTVDARYLARWDGRQWSCPGSGLNSPAGALAIGSDGCLYAAGGFSSTGDNLLPLVHFGIYCPGAP